MPNTYKHVRSRSSEVSPLPPLKKSRMDSSGGEPVVVTGDKTAKIVAEMQPRAIRRLLPQDLVKICRNVETKAEWQKKTRFLMAFLFTRFHTFSDKTLDEILNAIQPIGNFIVKAEDETKFVQDLLYELQNCICVAHEALARAAVDSCSVASTWIDSINRERKRAITQLDKNELERELALELQDIKALWAPLLDIVSPEYWDSKAINRDPTGQTRTFFESLVSKSIDLVYRFIKALHTGKRAHRDLSVKSRVTDLKQIAVAFDPGFWPILPPTNTGELPKTVITWEAREDHYHICWDAPHFVDVFERLGGPAMAVFKHMNPNKSDDDDDDDCVIADSPPRGSFTINDCPESPIHFDEDGMKIPNVHEKDSDDPFCSVSMECGLEENRVPREVFQGIKDISEEDTSSVKMIISALSDDVFSKDTVSARAHEISALGPFGLARYAIHLLRSSVEIYDAVIDELLSKKTAALTLVAKVEQARTEALESHHKAEAAKAEFRTVSSNLSNTRRNLASIMRQRANDKYAAGHRAPSSFYQGPSSPHPLSAPPSHAAPAPHTPKRQHVVSNPLGGAAGGLRIASPSPSSFSAESPAAGSTAGPDAMQLDLRKL